MQMLICLISLFFWQQRSRTGIDSISLELLHFQINSIYDGVEFVVLILLAKGWKITRRNLTRDETRRIGAVVLLWIITHGTYKTFKNYLIYVVITVYILIIHYIAKNIKENRMMLYRQLRVMQNSGLDMTPTSPLLVKLRIFKRLRFAVMTYMCIPLISTMFGITLWQKNPWVENAIEEAIKFIMAIIFGMNLWLRPFAPCYYRIKKNGEDEEPSICENFTWDEMYEWGLVWRPGRAQPSRLIDSDGWFGIHMVTANQVIIVQHPSSSCFKRHSLSVANPLGKNSGWFVPLALS